MIQKAAQPSKAWTAKSSVDGRLKSARLALKTIGPHDPSHVHADSGDPSGTITRVSARSSGSGNSGSSPRPIYRPTRPIATPCATFGNRLEQFLREEPPWSALREELALDMCVSSGRRSSHSTGDRSRRSVPTISWILRRRGCGSACSRIFRCLIWTTPWMISYIAVKKRESDVLRGEASNAASLLRRRLNAANGSARQNKRRFT